MAKWDDRRGRRTEIVKNRVFIAEESKCQMQFRKQTK